MYGRIVSSWKITNEEITVEVEIPTITSAQIVLPFAKLSDIKENGKGLTESAGIVTMVQNVQDALLKVRSGHYCFVYKNERGFTKIIQLKLDY